MLIDEIVPGKPFPDPYLIIGESKSEFVIIGGHQDEEVAVIAYEKLLTAVRESSRSRYEAVQLVRVLRHVKIS